MAAYTSITIIYNPNSTGSSEAMARDMLERLKQASVRPVAELIATDHAGHGEKLAYELASATAHPLVISASGDGGYHDVVNGLMRAKQDGFNPVAGLLPAGNANDHFHALHDEDIVEAIIARKTQTIDLLKMRAMVKGELFERYAHSYIGIGLTPKVGRELNKTQLNRFNEVWIALKVLITLRPVHVTVNGRSRILDSLVFSNVNKMSKVLSLSEEADVRDGHFEVTAFERRHKLRLITRLLKASTLGLKGTRHVSEYAFTTTKALLIQLDGEIVTLDANSDVVITLEHAALECIV